MASDSNIKTAGRPGRQLVAFYALALLIVFGVMATFFYLSNRDPNAGGVIARLVEFIQAKRSYMNVINIVQYALREPETWLIIVFASAPTLAALVVAAATGTLRDLLGRFRPIMSPMHRSSGLRAYQWMAAINIVVCASLLGYSYISQGDAGLDRLMQHLGGSLPLVVLIVLLGGFLDEGGALEELGWRGFAQPRLTAIMASPLAASLLLGLLWWAWHLPRELPVLLSGVTGQFFTNQTAFLALCLGESVVIAYFVNRTGGSVIPAILIHGGSNVWSKALSDYTGHLGPVGVRDIILIAGAVLLVALSGKQLGRLPGAKP